MAATTREEKIKLAKEKLAKFQEKKRKSEKQETLRIMEKENVDKEREGKNEMGDSAEHEMKAKTPYSSPINSQAQTIEKSRVVEIFPIAQSNSLQEYAEPEQAQDQYTPAEQYYYDLYCESTENYNALCRQTEELQTNYTLLIEECGNLRGNVEMVEARNLELVQRLLEEENRVLQNTGGSKDGDQMAELRELKNRLDIRDEEMTRREREVTLKLDQLEIEHDQKSGSDLEYLKEKCEQLESDNANHFDTILKIEDEKQDLETRLYQEMHQLQEQHNSDYQNLEQQKNLEMKQFQEQHFQSLEPQKNLEIQQLQEQHNLEMQQLQEQHNSDYNGLQDQKNQEIQQLQDQYNNDYQNMQNDLNHEIQRLQAEALVLMQEKNATRESGQESVILQELEFIKQQLAYSYEIDQKVTRIEDMNKRIISVLETSAISASTEFCKAVVELSRTNNHLLSYCARNQGYATMTPTPGTLVSETVHKDSSLSGPDAVRDLVRSRLIGRKN